jgi:sterol desaturase/sphingolipid hydroxylase (fatty acid hydroxylase superfamily)
MLIEFLIIYCGITIIYFSSAFISDYFTINYPTSNKKIQIYDNTNIMISLWVDALYYSFYNFIIYVPPCIAFYCYIMENIFIREYSWFYILNGPIMMFIYMYISGIYFYIIHYGMHKNKIIYKYIHKLHHKWTKPFAISALAVHPLELIVVNLITVSIPTILLPYTHVIWIYIYFYLSIINVLTSHCGWIDITNGFHDLHHKHFNCNYGIEMPIIHMDKIFNTYLEFDRKKII